MSNHTQYRSRRSEFTTFLRGVLKRLCLDRTMNDILYSCSHTFSGTVQRAQNWIPSFFVFFIETWWKCMTWFWITLPTGTCSLLTKFLKSIARYFTRRSLAARKFVLHVLAIWDILENIGYTLMNINLSVLFVEIMQAIGDIVWAWLTCKERENIGGGEGIECDGDRYGEYDGSRSSITINRHKTSTCTSASSSASSSPRYRPRTGTEAEYESLMSFGEISELISYEELSERPYSRSNSHSNGNSSTDRDRDRDTLKAKEKDREREKEKESMYLESRRLNSRMKQSMHHYIPAQTFRATVKVRSLSSSPFQISHGNTGYGVQSPNAGIRSGYGSSGGSGRNTPTIYNRIGRSRSVSGLGIGSSSGSALAELSGAFSPLMTSFTQSNSTSSTTGTTSGAGAGVSNRGHWNTGMGIGTIGVGIGLGSAVSTLTSRVAPIGVRSIKHGNGNSGTLRSSSFRSDTTASTTTTACVSPNRCCTSPIDDDDEEEEEENNNTKQFQNKNRDGNRDSSIIQGGGDSPASFPSTPFSRTRVMNKNSDSVISTLFAARDKLRLEAQSTSHDEHSRRSAVAYLGAKCVATYNPHSTQTSDGLALTCGNHCVLKVGSGLCYSSRASIPIQNDVYVYFEYSITASVGISPILCIGVSTVDTPLNTMAGAAPTSIGLHTDGRFLVANKWFHSSGTGTVTGRATSAYSSSDPCGDGDPYSAHFIVGSGNERTIALLSNPNANANANANINGNVAADSKTMSAIETTTNTATPITIKSGSTVGILIRIEKTKGRESSPEDTASASATEDQQDMNKDKDKDKNNMSSLFIRMNIDGKVLPMNSACLHAISDVSKQLLSPSSFSSSSSSSLSLSSSSPSIHIRVQEQQQLLYPTVSLISSSTRVWCRFDHEDIVYTSYNAIGAPMGAKVYCLDGSLLNG